MGTRQNEINAAEDEELFTAEVTRDLLSFARHLQCWPNCPAEPQPLERRKEAAAKLHF